MSKEQANAVGEAMRLMAEAVEMAWKHDEAAAAKMSKAVRLAKWAVEVNISGVLA